MPALFHTVRSAAGGHRKARAGPAVSTSSTTRRPKMQLRTPRSETAAAANIIGGRQTSKSCSPSSVGFLAFAMRRCSLVIGRLMLLQECCETSFSRLNLIMTKMRNNLLVVTLDALMMLFINDPSLEPDVPSPTIELSEMCKLGYLHWTKAKNRNSKRCHQVSRARAHEVTAEQCVSRCARVQAFSAWRLRG